MGLVPSQSASSTTGPSALRTPTTTPKDAKVTKRYFSAAMENIGSSDDKFHVTVDPLLVVCKQTKNKKTERSVRLLPGCPTVWTDDEKELTAKVCQLLCTSTVGDKHGEQRNPRNNVQKKYFTYYFYPYGTHIVTTENKRLSAMLVGRSLFGSRMDGFPDGYIVARHPMSDGRSNACSHFKSNATRCIRGCSCSSSRTRRRTWNKHLPTFPPSLPFERPIGDAWPPMGRLQTHMEAAVEIMLDAYNERHASEQSQPF